MARFDPLMKLVEQLQRLPGIGAKSAQRLAFHILKTPREEVERLADAMREVKDRVTYCTTCSNITDVDPCYYCTDSSRDHRLICVVEEPENVSAIEKTRDFKGLNPNVEGEATAIYLAKLLKPLGVRVTRIAMGVPVGSDLEYADEVTMQRAMEGRREV
jgi:recombination protein RecR